MEKEKAPKQKVLERNRIREREEQKKNKDREKNGYIDLSEKKQANMEVEQRRVETLFEQIGRQSNKNKE